LSKIPALEN